MRILYFSWLREKVGAGTEEVAPPPGVVDARSLVAWLGQRSPGHAAAFADLTLVRVAVNQEHVGLDHRVAAGDEVAFFPPVTGGSG